MSEKKQRCCKCGTTAHSFYHCEMTDGKLLCQRHALAHLKQGGYLRCAQCGAPCSGWHLEQPMCRDCDPATYDD